MTARMGKLVDFCAVLAAMAIIGCRDRAPAGPNAGELSELSPETFSHADPGAAEDARCLGQEGVLVSPTSIGPVRLGRSLKSLRGSCAIAVVKVPASIAINGPVLGVSVDGGLILFTVAGKDSAVATAGTSSPGFRTLNGIGVGSTVRQIPPAASTICFKRDSTRVAEIFISQRPVRC